ncbi:MAG: hypothetical protein H6555_04425 [Lewinellaceae bacterium]|nr:hypothetical protein [Lewinellaceae bacterium]
MPKKPQQNHLQEWLEQLQRDSWNLELLVSGFSIFLLFGAIERLETVFGNIWVATGYPNSFNFIINFFVSVLFFGAITLVVNLIIHILLRGFWIGAIGLRSINTEISVDTLGYTPRFTRYLQERLPRLDTLLEQLDRICSGIFAFAFLVALMFLSLFLYIGVSIIIVSIINNLASVLPSYLEFPLRSLGVIFTIAWLGFGFIYFLDTLMIGSFKRLRYNRFYFWVYRIASWCSGSFLYRALYYHLGSPISPAVCSGLFGAFYPVAAFRLLFLSSWRYFRHQPDTPEQYPPQCVLL